MLYIYIYIYSVCVRYLVVYITVGEHGVEVLHALSGAAVVVVLQSLLDGAHVHRGLYYRVVILPNNITPGALVLV